MLAHVGLAANKFEKQNKLDRIGPKMWSPVNDSTHISIHTKYHDMTIPLFAEGKKLGFR